MPESPPVTSARRAVSDRASAGCRVKGWSLTFVAPQPTPLPFAPMPSPPPSPSAGQSETVSGARERRSRRGTAPAAAPGSLASSSPFPPISDYGFLSDCHTGALVASDGSIEWMCLPYFGSPSIFGALLDRGAGSWRVGPYGTYVPACGRYIPGTNMIETTWMTPQGWLRVIDALTIGEWHDNEHGSSHTRPPTDYDADHLLVRMIECIQGQVQVEIVVEPMLDYGSVAARWSVVDSGQSGFCAKDATDDV